MFETLNSDMEDMKKKNQIELLDLKIIMLHVKNTPDDINSRLDMIEEKFSELDGIVIEALQMKDREWKHFFDNEKY